jgi:predicted ArsR family transcriptional regulator
MTARSFQGLLRRLASGTAQTIVQLATELDVDRELLEQMLLDLERAGYLRIVRGCADGRCRSCDLQALCTLGQPQRVWLVTEKGSRAAKAP